MATSSKVRFNLETLRERAMEALNERISRATLALDAFHDDAAQAVAVEEWRQRQIAKVLTLAQQLTDDADKVDNYRLIKFRLDEFPEQDRYDRRDAARTLERLLTLRNKIEAKAESISPDENGTVSLTKTQLEDFFGL